MTQTYYIQGMHCNGCKHLVEERLNKVEGVKNASVDLPNAKVLIESEKLLPITSLQKSLEGTSYHISTSDEKIRQPKIEQPKQTSASGSGIYYCPMHCEGDKTYDKPGSCPVCGMDLVAMPSLNKTAQYTCPMHPQVIQDKPGACPICGMDLVPMEANVNEENKAYKTLLNKFIIAVAFTLPIFIIAMTEMIPNNPLFKIMDLKYWNWVQMALSLPVVFYAAWIFFERAWRSVVTRHLNMFTLIGIGSGIAWLFSLAALLFPQVFPDEFKTHHGTVYVYFEAATVILTLVLLGQLMEAKAHVKTNSAIKALLELAPNTAFKIIDGKEQLVSIDDIQRGDILQVKPGGKIPVDGKIKTGHTHIDESMISGEPIPVNKKEGDEVKAGTINGTGSFVMIAEKVGSETLIARIIQMVHAANRSKAPIQNLADKISGYFVPVVIFISAITFILWSVFGPSPSHVYALVNAIAVLIIACPCALGLATPMSVMVGVGKGAQSGILFKDAEALEKICAVDVIIMDKTGTLTEGQPSVIKVISVQPDYSEADIIQKIVAVNSKSEHPLAQAVLRYGEQHHFTPAHITHFEAVSGKGAIGVLEGKKLALGNERLMEQQGTPIPLHIAKQVEVEQQSGRTVSYLSEENNLLGYVVISDKIKPNAKEAVQRLQMQGMEVWMFTGDHDNSARAVSDALHLNGYKARMLPENKLEEIKALQAAGKKVAMAGDGINDAPALSQADVGIAMGTGTDAAIESAQITLVKGDLKGITNARLLSEKVMKNIKQNLWFALGYNIIGIPIAAGVLYPTFGLLLSPMIAALAMSFSSVSVIANSLRLRSIPLIDKAPYKDNI